jgi:transposase InsO family protein
LNRIRDLEPAEPVRRYERETPGEMTHIGIKKLGRFDKIGHHITGDCTGHSNNRGVGWEFFHVCIDDHSRVAFRYYQTRRPKAPWLSSRQPSIIFKSLAVTVTSVMTDNGCYKAFDFRAACQELGLKHERTRPFTPKINGKAERFIQTALREWAYAQAYPTSDRRAEELPHWPHRYNWHRLKSQTHISSLGLAEDNLLRLHS